jgi:hypothetical protein
MIRGDIDRLVTGILKNAPKMGSGAMIYIPYFIGSGIQTPLGRIHKHTYNMETSLAFFFFSK